MSNYDEFDLDIIQTGTTGNVMGPDSITSVEMVYTSPCLITQYASCQCTYDCSRPISLLPIIRE